MLFGLFGGSKNSQSDEASNGIVGQTGLTSDTNVGTVIKVQEKKPKGLVSIGDSVYVSTRRRTPFRVIGDYLKDGFRD